MQPLPIPSLWQRLFALESHMHRTPGWRDYISSAVLALLAIIAMYGLEQLTLERYSNITSVLILSVLFSAIYFGIGPSILNALMCTFLFDYFFVPPFFTSNNIDNLVKFTIFTITAFITSWVASTARTYAVDARNKEQRIHTLYKLSERLAETMTVQAMVDTAEQTLQEYLHVNASIVLEPLPPQGGLAVAVQRDAPVGATRSHAVRHGKEWRFPMRSNRGIMGFLTVGGDDASSLPIAHDVLAAAVTHITTSIERLLLLEEKEKALIDKEREAMRSALLMSVSHDLKTPLATIIGTSSTLLSTYAQLKPNARTALIQTTLDEASRLDRFVTNLLDMTRLEATPPSPLLTPMHVEDIVDSAIKRSRKQLQHCRLDVHIPAGLPLAQVNSAFIEQAIVNVLDNAAKYCPEGGMISFRAHTTSSTIVLDIEDDGIGLPEEAFEKVFGKFYRVQYADRKTAGTGLGLTISRAMVEACGGAIAAMPPQRGHGARFQLRLPSAPIPDQAA